MKNDGNGIEIYGYDSKDAKQVSDNLRSKIRDRVGRGLTYVGRGVATVGGYGTIVASFLDVCLVLYGIADSTLTNAQFYKLLGNCGYIVGVPLLLVATGIGLCAAGTKLNPKQ